MKKFIATMTSVAMAFTLAACGGETASNQDSSKVVNGKLEDGTYSSEVQGMNDLIHVDLTVEGGNIKDINVEDKETIGIGSPLCSKDGTVLTGGGEAPDVLIPNFVKENGTLGCDNVTGATITSAVLKSAIKDCLEQAGADMDEWNKKYEYTTREGKEADAIVVGGGGAGLAAAISLAEQGKSVVVIEKNGEVGGDTLVCGAIYNTPDKALQEKVEMSDPVKDTLVAALSEEPINEEHASLQAEVQKQWDAYNAEGRTDLFDSKEWYALQTYINGDKVANMDLVKALCYNAYDGLVWIEDLGMEFHDEISQGAGSLWQRTHTSMMNMGTGFLSTYVEQMDKHSDLITFVNEATATKLTTEDGKVTGVIATDNHTDEDMTFKANEAVVIATGGFAGNAKMVQEYNTSGKWNDLSKTATTNRKGCSQGDGIKMAQEIGASVTDMDQIQLLYLGNTSDGQISKQTRRSINGTDQIIFINKNGERFVQEDGRRDQICLAVLDQPDAMFYVLESGDGDKYEDIKDPEWRSSDGFTFDYLVDNGWIYYDETLEGLADQLDMDVDTLKATLANFNEAVDSGKDEFGRTLFSTKLEKGPWVVTPRQACLHHTMGGLTIDDATRVLNEDGDAIEGLYAAGEVTGGIHGANRLGGNAVVDTVVFGKMAGDTIVEDTK